MHTRFLPSLIAIAGLATVPFVTACYCVDDFEPYATHTDGVSLVSGTPDVAPIRITAPVSTNADPIVLEIGSTDCAAAELVADVRLLTADGTTITPLYGGPTTFECPGAGARFRIEPSTLTCTGSSCSIDLDVEVTSETTMGDRAIEARLLRGRAGSCLYPRSDATVAAVPAP